MIAVIDIWNRLNDYGQKYQSGTDTVAYFNSKLAEVQIETFNLFAPLYDQNEKIKTLLDVWVKEQSGSSNSLGIVALGTAPDVVSRPLAIGYVVSAMPAFSISSIDETELIAIARIPQRAPNSAGKKVYYRFNSPSLLQFYPKETVPYDAFYLTYPTAAKIAFTYTTVSNEDIMSYDSINSVNLLWPQAAFNLILYGMLEKYGISVREQLLQEYAKYGIAVSASMGGEKQ